MNIGFDAKRAFLNTSGLGNYSRSLIKSLAQNFSDNQYQLFTTQIKTSAFSDFVAHQKNFQVFEPQNFLSKKIPSIWRSYEITEQLNNLNCQVYHGLSNELPLNIQKFKGKKIVSIHDLIFLRYPELYPIIDREIYDRKFRKACEQADTVIAISEQTKQDLQSFYKIDAAKIKVVYQSCDELFSATYQVSFLKTIILKYNLPSDFILSVGTIEERKDLLTLVKALNLLKNAHLVVVGKKRDYFKVVNDFCSKHKLQNRILFLENVPNNDLPALYQLANVFVYPSLFEGFGIPILEAIQSKTPVIAANSSSLPEVGGAASLYFEASNYEALAVLMQKLMDSKDLRTTQAERAFEEAQKFNPKVLAAQLINIYAS